jgi:hypothetical protein
MSLNECVHRKEATKRQKVKKAGTIAGPGPLLAGCPDKIEAFSRRDRSGSLLPKS